MKVEVGNVTEYQEIPTGSTIRITLDNGNEIRVKVYQGKVSISKMSWNEDGELHVTPSASNQIYVS